MITLDPKAGLEFLLELSIACLKWPPWTQLESDKFRLTWIFKNRNKKQKTSYAMLEYNKKQNCKQMQIISKMVLCEHTRRQPWWPIQLIFPMQSQINWHFVTGVYGELQDWATCNISELSCPLPFSTVWLHLKEIVDYKTYCRLSCLLHKG